MSRTRLALALLMTLSMILTGCESGGKNLTPMPGEKSAVDTLWDFADWSDPNALNLIAADQGGETLHLKPDWEVSSVEYVDDWFGGWSWRLDDQMVKREGTIYKYNGTTVPDTDVQALVKAINNLYPAQMLMEGNDQYDNYPARQVELIGTDRQHIILYSSSLDNPGNGPWNVLYNGRLYAQYDGSVAKPLVELFPTAPDTMAGSYNPGRHIPDNVTFSTIGLPSHLTYGFWGLLPLSKRFKYTADLTSGEIKGQVSRISLGSDSKIDDLDKLSSIKFSVGGNQVTCATRQLPQDEPWSSDFDWSFTCPVQGAKEGKQYSYPIVVRFDTVNGKSMDFTGELWGKWTSAGSREYFALAPPQEISAAISSSAATQDLMTDHILGSTHYIASMSADNPLGGKRGGEVILYGQTQIEDKPVRYTVGAQFAVEDGKLTYWDLDRAALNEMLNTITTQPLTRRILAAKPDTVLNLWYAKGTPQQEKASFDLDGGPTTYSVEVNSCGAIPGGTFPGAKPLQAFDYDTTPYLYFDRLWTERRGPPFVLINGRVVLAGFNFYSPQLEPIQKLLLPDVLNMSPGKPFQHISMYTSYTGGGFNLDLGLPEKIDPSELAAYEEHIKALPGYEKIEGSNRQVIGVTFVPNDQGKLEVINCAATLPKPTP